MRVWPVGLVWRWKDYMFKELNWVLFFGQIETIDKLIGYLYEWFLTSEIEDPDLREKLRPNFKLGCKRVLISDEYYRSMNKKNFTLDDSPILSLTKVKVSY